MAHKRLVFAVYASVVVCVWWLLGHSESFAGWILALLIVALGLSADYFITEAPELPLRLREQMEATDENEDDAALHPSPRRTPGASLGLFTRARFRLWPE